MFCECVSLCVVFMLCVFGVFSCWYVCGVCIIYVSVLCVCVCVCVVC